MHESDTFGRRDCGVLTCQDERQDIGSQMLDSFFSARRNRMSCPHFREFNRTCACDFNTDSTDWS